jgi:hypothetical protein
MTQWFRAVLLAGLAAALWGCSGGGGGGGGGGSNRFVIHADRTSVSFNYIQGEIPAPQNIRLTWTGEPPPDGFFTGATFQGTGLSERIEVSISETEAFATLSPARRLFAGTYSGTVQLLACSDAACNQRIGGTPITVSYTITVRNPVFTGPPLIELTHTRWTPPPPGTTLQINDTAGTWTTVAPPWIKLSQTSGTGPATVAVSLDPTGITRPGLFSDKVTVNGTGGVSQSTEVKVLVTQPMIMVDSLRFSGVNGSTFAPQTAVLTIGNNSSLTLPMSVTSAEPWLKINSASTSASTSTPAAVSISVDPAGGMLASGEYSGAVNLRLGTPADAAIVPIDVQLSLTKATLTFTPGNLVLGGTLGRTFPSMPVSISLDTDSHSYAWSATGAQAWASLSRSNGTVSATPQPILLTPHWVQSTPGTATTTLHFSSQINGDLVTADLPVSFNLDTHRVIASDDGVALVDVPGTTWDRLSRTVKIKDNFGLNTAWTATADQPWLQVTAAGTNGSDLVMTADTSGMSVDQLSTATVTISTTDATVAGPERIRVGLWVGSTAPSTPLAFNAVSSFFWSAVGDPIRPYVYAYEQGTTSVRVFNVYSGTELPRINGLPAGFLRAMFVSTDGATLYLWGGNTVGFVPIDLASGAVGTPIPTMLSFLQGRDRFKYIRPNGVGLLVDSSAEVFLASTGEILELGFISSFDVSGDSQRAFHVGGTELIDFTSAGGGTFVRTPAPGIPGFDSDLTFGSNFDGSRVYATATQGPSAILAGNGVTGQTLAPLGSSQVNRALLVTRDGNIFLLTDSTGMVAFHAYAPDGTELVTPVVTGTLPGFHEGVLSVAGGGHFGIAVSHTPNERVHVIPIPPP